MSKTPRTRRWTGWSARRPSLLRPFPQLRVEELEARTTPASLTWTGAGGNSNWNNPGNWGGSTPASGDNLSFPAGVSATLRNTTNNLPIGTVFNSITISDSNYTLGGNAITLGQPGVSGNISVAALATNDIINLDIGLGSSAGSKQFFTVGSGGDLTLNGQVSGSTGAIFTKEGTGLLILSNDNTGFTGPFLVDNNAGALQITNAKALGDTSNETTVGTNSTLQVSNVSDPINEQLRLNGPGVSNLGALRAVAGTSTWAGPIILDSNATFGADSGAVVKITGQISDSGSGHNVAKEGTGEVQFDAANTYRGSTTVNNGLLTVGNASALGTSDGTPATGTIVNETNSKAGTLGIAGPAGSGFTILNEYLNINGDGLVSSTTLAKNQFPYGFDGYGIGALYNSSGNNNWAGPVAIGSAASNTSTDYAAFGAAVNTDLIVSGVIADGAAGFLVEKVEPGRVIFNNANTYSGKTRVYAGTLDIRDSKGLGTGSVDVIDGATLELEVEAATSTPRYGYKDPTGSPLATARDLWDDSVTHDPNRLDLSNPIQISGRGFQNTGALRSLSGINRVLVNVQLSAIGSDGSIGVDLDQRPGHPTPSSAYLTDDYSLTILGDIKGSSGTSFIKRGAGQLILPGANSYTGVTQIEQGWVTIENNNSLGGRIPGLGDTVQPRTYVLNGAAIHVLSPDATTHLNIQENITLSGTGFSHPYSFINSKGALMNIGGDNTWSGDIQLLGTAGIGVEQVDPTLPTSQLTVTGSLRDAINKQTFTGDGGTVEQVYWIDAGATSTTYTINWDMFPPPIIDPPDRLTVYNQPRFQPGVTPTQLFDTGYVSGPGSKILPVGPGANQITEFVMNENPPGGTRFSRFTLTVSSPTVPGNLVKYGSQRLRLQGDGTYTGFTDVVEGTLRAENDSALGHSSSGTNTTQQTYNQTDTTVASGAVLEMRSGVASLNGGIATGIGIWDEHLILDGSGYQLSVAGDPLSATYTLTYQGPNFPGNPLDTFTTQPISVNASALDVQNALVDPLLTADGEVATVTQNPQYPSIYSIVFGNALSKNVTLTAAPSGGAEIRITDGQASLATIAPVVTGSISFAPDAVNGDTITRNDGGSWLAAGYAVGDSIAVTGSTGANNATFTIASLSGSVLVLTAKGVLVADNAASATVADQMQSDDTWRGPVTLEGGSRVRTDPNTRLELLGAIDDDPANNATGSDFTKRGEGELLLGGLNSYRGTTLIDQGIVTAENSQAFGFGDSTDASGTIVSTNAQLQLQGGLTVASEKLTIEGSGPDAASVPTSIPIHWQQVGPAPINNGQTFGSQPVTGRVTGTAVDPTDPNVIYISTAGGGAWKTKDGGHSWLPLFDLGAPDAPLRGGAIAINPADPTNIFYGSGEINNSGDSYAGTGLYESNDSGRTWRLVTGPGNLNPIYGQSVSKIAIQPPNTPNGLFNPLTVFIGTSDFQQLSNPAGAPGVWRWDSTNWVNMTSIVSTVRATQKGQSPFDGAPVNTPGPDDDYRITFPQSNVSWTDLQLVYFDTDVTKPSPNTSPPVPKPVLYASLMEQGGTYFPAARNGFPTSYDLGGYNSGVYRSENPDSNLPFWYVGDSGATSSAPAPKPDNRSNVEFPVGPFKNGLPDLTLPPLNGRIQLAVDPTLLAADPNLPPGTGRLFTSASVFAAVTYPIYNLGDGNDARFKAVMHATDSGKNWAATGVSPGMQDYMGTAPIGQGWYDTTIVAKDANTVYVGGSAGESLWQTTDGGLDWNDISFDSAGNGPHADQHAMALDSSGNLILGNDGGMWRFNPSTSLWDDINGNLAITTFNGLDVHPTDYTIAYGGSQDNGTEKFTGSLAWNHVDAGDGGVVQVDPINPNNVYHILNGRIQKSTNAGASWSTIFQPFGAGLYFQFVLDQINPQRIVTGTGGGSEPGFDVLYESLDGGASFNDISGTYPGGEPTSIALAQFQGQFVADPAFSAITDIGSNIYDSKTIYVTDGSSIYVTKDDGLTWVARTGIVNGDIEGLAVDASNRDTAYAVIADRAGTNPSRIYRTTDAGRTWVDISGNVPGGTPLPDQPVWSVVVDPRVNPQTGISAIYVGTDIGVYASFDGGITWGKFGSGMPNVQVKNLVLNQSLNTLSAGTYGRSMYQIFLDSSKADSGAIRAVSGNSTWTGPVTLTGNATIGADGTQNIQNGIAAASLNIIGNITDGGGDFTITKVGQGTVIFSGANTYGGQTLVKEGVLEVNNSSALGATAPAATANTIVDDGASLELATDLYLEPVTINGNGFFFNNHFTGSLRNISGFNTYTGQLTFGTQNVAAAMATITNGTGAVAEVQTATVAASSGNFRLTYLGVTTGAIPVNADATTVQDALNALSTIAAAGGVTVGRSGPANNYVYSITFNNTGNRSPITSTGITIGVDSGTQLTIGGLPGSPALGIGSITDGGSGYAWDKELAGTLVLASANTLGGLTRVVQGALRVEDGGALGSADVGTQVLDGAQIQLSRNPYTLTQLINSGNPFLPSDYETVVPAEPLYLSGTGIFATGAIQNVLGDSIPGESNDNTWSGPIQLTELPNFGPTTAPGPVVSFGSDTANQSLIVNTVIVQDPVTGGVQAYEVDKVGPGIVVFAQDNGYTGATNVNAGSLRIQASNALGPQAPSQVQLVSLSTTNPAASYQLMIGGIPTALLHPSDSAATVQAALETILGAGNVYVGETPNAGGKVLTVVFHGALDGVDISVVYGAMTAPLQSGVTVTIKNAATPAIAGTTVNAGSLELDGSTAGVSGLLVGEALTLHGDGVDSFGALNNVAGDNTYSGSITLATSPPPVIGTAIGAVTGTTLMVTGKVQDPATVAAVIATTQDGTGALPEIQTVQVNASTGYFALSFTNPAGITSTTATIPVNAAGGDVQAALNAMPSIANYGTGGSVVVTQSGAANSYTYTVQFAGSLATGNQIQMAAVGVPVPAARLLKAGEGTVIFPDAKDYGGATVIADGILNIRDPQSLGRPRDEVQSIDVVATNGSFALSFRGQTTAALPFNASAIDVQNALNALSSIGGAGGNVVVTSTGLVNGKTTFTITFSTPAGNTLQNSNVDAIVPVYVAPVIVTTRQGSAILPEVQTVQVNASTGAFALTFTNPAAVTSTTVAIPVNASAATVQNALNAIPAIAGYGSGGSVIVSQAGPVNNVTYTISFAGSLGAIDVNQLGSAVVGGALVTQTTLLDGQDGSTVESGGTLQIEGLSTNFFFPDNGELLTLNGQGFNNLGALNLLNSQLVWDDPLPILLGSDASIGTSSPTDTLVMNSPISDTGLGYGLDLYGPGKVTFAGTGTTTFAGDAYGPNFSTTYSIYTGNTTVHDGSLFLDVTGAGIPAIRGNLFVGDGVGAAGSALVQELLADEVNDSSQVTVNSDGVFDLNGLSDTFGPLTVNGGTVYTNQSGTGGNLTTGTVNMTGGLIAVSDGGTLTTGSTSPVIDGSVTMSGGAQITAGVNTTLTFNGDLAMDASSITFASPGPATFNVLGNTDLENGSSINLPLGSMSTQDLTVGPGSTLTIGDNSTLTAHNIVDNGGTIIMGNNDVLTATGKVTVENGGTITMGTDGIFGITGDLTLQDGTISMGGTTAGNQGTKGLLSAASISMTGASSISLGDYDTLKTTTGGVSIVGSDATNKNGVISLGDNGTFTAAGDVLVTNGQVAFGTNGNFNNQPFDLSLNNSLFTMGTGGTAKSGTVSISNASVMSFGDSGTLQASGNLLMSGAGQLSFLDDGQATAADISITGGGISFQDNGKLHATGNLNDIGGAISFKNAGSFTIDGASVSVTNGGSIGFGVLSVPAVHPYVTGDTGSSFSAPNAAANFDNSQFWMGDSNVGAVFGSLGINNGSQFTFNDHDTLTDNGVLVLTGASGMTFGNFDKMTTQDVSQNGGLISFLDNGEFDAGSVSEVVGQISFGNTGKLISNGPAGVSVSNGGSITFGTTGVLSTAAGGLTLNKGTVTLGDDGTIATQAIVTTGASKIQLGNNVAGTLGTITATSVNVGPGGSILLGNSDTFTATGGVTATNAANLSFGTGGKFLITGDLNLNNSPLSMGNSGLVQVAGTGNINLTNAAKITFADAGTLFAAGSLGMSGLSKLSFGNNGIATITKDLNLTTGSISMLDGADAAIYGFTVQGNATVQGAAIAIGNKEHFTVAGDASIAVFGASPASLAIGSNSTLNTGSLTLTTATVAIGDNSTGTTGDITILGATSKVTAGNGVVLNTGNVTSNVGTGTFILGNNDQLLATGAVQFTSGSITFGTSGKLAATGDLTLHGTPINLGAGTAGSPSIVSADHILLDTSSKAKITFSDFGQLSATSTLTVQDGGLVKFGNTGKLTTGGDVTLVNSNITGGTNIAISIGGSLKMDPSSVVVGDGSTATIAGDIDITGGSISLGNNAGLAVTGTITDDGALIAIGANSNFSAAAATLTDAATFTQGTASLLTGGTFTITTGAFSLTGSTASLGLGISGSVVDVALVDGTIAIGAGSTIAITGNLSGDSTAAGNSSITGAGTVDLGNTTHAATVGDGDAKNNVDLAITTNITAGASELLVKSGAGRLELAGASNQGGVNITGGDVQVDQSAGPIQINGGSLSGKGTVGAITGAGGGSNPVVGAVAPGNNWQSAPYGALQSGPVLLGPASTFFVDLSSSTPHSPAAGTDYDQLNVAGNIDLGGAALGASFGPGIMKDDVYTIITATGTVSGKFQQFNSQDVIFVGGQKFDIVYEPNDVKLVKVRADLTSLSETSAPNPSTLNQVVTLTALITPEPGALLIPNTTTATFLIDNVAVATAPVVANGAQFQAVFQTNAMTSGTHSLTVMFDGDPNNFNPFGPSSPITQTVQTPTIDPLTGVPTGTPAYISPNNSPGVRDQYALSTQVNDERGAINWNIAIKDSGSATVQTLSGSGNPGAGTTIPINATWDGKLSGGAFAPDGNYTATATFTDSFGNTFSTSPIPIVVDNTSPTAIEQPPTNGVIDPTAASTLPPNTILSGTVGDLNLSGWTVDIRTQGGVLLREYTNTGSGTIVNVNWDGKYDPAHLVDPVNPTQEAPDGAYLVTITATDLAGNQTTSAAQTVVVLAHGPVLTLSTGAPSVYGDAYTLTATAGLPAGSPASLISQLAGDTIQFFEGATLLGSSTLAFNNITGKYEATFAGPIKGAGTYTDFQAVYPATADFPQGTSSLASHIITPKSITLTADNQVRQYGDPNPALTFQVAPGLVNGDTNGAVFTGSLATTATAASGVAGSPYPITQGTLAANSNYQITGFTAGNLSVIPRSVTVTIDDKTRVVNTPNPIFTFTVNGLVNGDSSTDAVTSLPLTTTATTSSPVGAYPIVPASAPVSGVNYTVTNVTNGTLSVTPKLTTFAIGSDAGALATVNVYAPTGQIIKTLTPFGSFTGGVRTATGDFNGDGVDDLVIGTGPGVTAQVTVLDGKTGANLFTTFPFSDFTGGVFVAAGDINGDGLPELVVTPDEGGGPRVVAYTGGTFAPMLSYFGINDPSFRGGARAAVGDLNGDGFADIAVSAGFQGGPRVSLWDGKSLASLQFKNMTPDFFVFDTSLRNGAYLAIGDVNGDGKGDLIAGAGPGGSPHVKIFSGADMLNPAIGPSNTVPFASFFAGDPNNRGGVRVAAKVYDNDLDADVLTGVGASGGDTATAYLGSNLKNGITTPYFDLDVFPGLNNSGVFVG